MSDEVNLNLNLGSDPAPARNDTDQCKGTWELDEDHIADDTTAQTATAAASAEVNRGMEDLDYGHKFPCTLGNHSPMFVNIWVTGTGKSREPGTFVPMFP